MRIVIIEDLLMFREALGQICVRHGHIVVAEAGSASDGLLLAERHQPDVVLLDWRLRGGDGIELAERLMTTASPPRVLIVSAECKDYVVYRLERIGVHGFVDKRADSAAALGQALHALESGHRYFSDTFQSVARARKGQRGDYLRVLSEWERTILGHIGAGCSDDEIAQRTGISARTVQGHRSNMFRKLRIAGTPKLMAFAHEHGITPPCAIAGDGDGGAAATIGNVD